MSLAISSNSFKGLESAINKFYYSENYFINLDNKAENKKTGKKLGLIKKVKNRYQYHL